MGEGQSFWSSQEYVISAKFGGFKYETTIFASMHKGNSEKKASIKQD